MDDQVELVKSKTDIVQIISEHVSLKKAGRNLKANCPFHGEKTPSFMVNPELQIFKCFGCGIGGDAFTFLQKMEGMEFGEALKTLAERAGVKLTSYRPTQGEEVRERLIRANTLAADYYHYLLTKHELGKKALEYVRQRGLSEEAIAKFGIGYSPDGWDYLIKFLTQKKDFKLEELGRAGLATKNYDRFRNRIIFPLRNHRSQVLGFAGRVLPGADERQGGKYVNTAETELYHKSELLYGLDVSRGEIKQAGFAVVVEGEIDMIASWQAGVKNAVAVKGSALTERQVELLDRICDKVVLALDADLAGNMAARRGIETAEKAGMFVSMVNFEGFKDPGEVATADPGAWKKLVAGAIPIYSFYINAAVKKFGLTAEGKARVVRDVLPFLDIISDAVVKDEYVKELARKAEVEVEAVRSELAKATMTKSQISNKSQITNIDNLNTKRTRREVVEEYAVFLALRLEKVNELSKSSFIKTDFWKRAVEALKKDRAVAKLPAELRGKVEELLLWEEEPEMKEWEKTMRDLEEMTIREKIPQAKQDEMVKLTARLNELTKSR